MSAHYLSACAIFKNEGAYLREWLAFHHLVGIDHFYLYDNDSSDCPDNILAPFIASGMVTYTSCPGSVAQRRAYSECINNHKHDSRWIAFIDLDEFLFSPNCQSLPEVLAGYESYVGVGVNWVTFGSSGWLRAPSGLTIENYTWRGELDFVLPFAHLLRGDGTYRPMNTHIKSIVCPAGVEAPQTPHSFLFARGQLAVTENHVPIAGPWSDDVSVERLRINHYWTRSREECFSKIKRGRADSRVHRALSECETRDRLLNMEEDKSAVAYADGVKAWLVESM